MSDPKIKPEPDSPLAPPSPMAVDPPPTNFTASFTIWPPTQRTRDAVINRLTELFSTPSIISKRYGTMSADVASAAARQIEDEAFSVVNASSSSSDDSIQILQDYSKEITKRMIETVKDRSSSAVDSVAVLES